MSRPEDIPQDVWDAAAEIMRLHFHGTSARNQGEWDAHVLIAARAIMAERERCAAACNAFDAPASDSEFVNGQATAAQQIRAAIRGAP